MPSTTPNMGLTLPYESDNYDISVFNENFTKIDELPYIVEAGTAKAYHSNGNATVANYRQVTWYYKKYSDGTLEAHTVTPWSSWPCNISTTSGVWMSVFVRFHYPALGQKIIFHRSATVSQTDDTSVGMWASDVSCPGEGNDNLSYQSIRLLSLAKEETERYKNVYLSFKATWK